LAVYYWQRGYFKFKAAYFFDTLFFVKPILLLHISLLVYVAGQRKVHKTNCTKFSNSYIFKTKAHLFLVAMGLDNEWKPLPFSVALGFQCFGLQF
jgi:hypothetical protein